MLHNIDFSPDLYLQVFLFLFQVSRIQSWPIVVLNVHNKLDTTYSVLCKKSVVQKVRANLL